MPVDKKELEVKFTIPPTALALYPKLIIKISTAMTNLLNELKLAHQEVAPGEFLIHPDQVTLKNELSAAERRVEALKSVEKVFEGEIAGYNDKVEMISMDKHQEVILEIGDKVKSIETQFDKLNKQNVDLQELSETLQEAGQKHMAQIKELTDKVKVASEEKNSITAIMEDNKMKYDKKIAGLNKELKAKAKENK